MVLQKESSTKETNDQWVSRVGHALRNLDDRSVLNRSPLARLSYVERLAKEHYNSHVLPRGLALRTVLVACIERVINDLSKEPALSRACRYLALLKQGLSCRQISAELGLSRGACQPCLPPESFRTGDNCISFYSQVNLIWGKPLENRQLIELRLATLIAIPLKP